MAPSAAEARPAHSAVFLDRDGVINQLIEGDYVRHWSDFKFVPGSVEALARLHQSGAALLVVTNQRGVARGLVDPTELAEIHQRMADELRRGGAPLDGIYVCPHDVGMCDCRKPAPGLFEQARDAHPWIDFKRSQLVGDSMTDLRAGQRLGLNNWLVGPHRRRIRLIAALQRVRVAGSAATLADLVDDGALVATVSR